MSLLPVNMGGFMPGALGEDGLGVLPISRSVFKSGLTREIQDRMDQISRGEFGGQDAASVLAQLNVDMLASIQRAQTLSGVPVREDLEAEVTTLIPVHTPLRNRLPRTTGSGSVSSWEQETSIGGGYGVNTTVTAGATSATQTVGNVNGMQPGASLYFATSNQYAIIQSISNSTTIVLTTSITTTTGETVQLGPYAQPGQSPAQAFFAETGAPANTSPSYTKKTATYKFLGTMFSITGPAMAAGASFDNQLAMEKTAAIRRLMLIEEFALWQSTASNIYAPFGDGTNALGFDGLLACVSSSYGVPVPQLQTNVGALTTAHMDAQLTRLYNAGGMGNWIGINGQEALSLTHLAEASGSIIRVQATNDGDAILGIKLLGYKHPITGEIVPFVVSRFCPAGTIIFGSDYAADGKSTADVRVLPQVQLPQLAPNVNIQGYVAQELAPSQSSPLQYPGLVSVFETFRMKAAVYFAKSTGVTAV